MAGEKSGNKFMAMLERRGLVRKVDFDDEDSVAMEETLPVEENKADSAQYDDDLRTLMDLSGESSSSTRRMPTQPVHGISASLFSEDFSAKLTQAQQETPDLLKGSSSDDANEPQKAPDTASTQEYPISDLPEREEPIVMPYEKNQTAHEAPPVDAVAQAPVADNMSANNDVNSENSARNNLFSWIDNGETAAEEQPTVDNYAERYLDIEELYNVLSLNSKKTDTIYLIEDYIKSIPDSLPDESRRQIISKIVTASGFDFDLLMGDGVLRVKMLKEYAEKFARYTEDYVEARQNELAELETQIGNVNKLIEDRRELHKKQFLSLEAEAGRLREILAFINP